MDTDTTPAGVEARPYQQAAVAAVLARWDAGDDATLLVLPTGTGKTVVAGMIARDLRNRNGARARMLFLAHREELIHQAAARIGAFGLDCAIEMADQHACRADLFAQADVVIATVQTLQGRRLAGWPPGHFGALVTDEAHHARADTYQNIYRHFAGFEGCKHLGITATPDRGDGRNLGAVYQSLAFEYSLRDAIQEGYLVPLVTARLQTKVDLRDIRTTGGDFNQGDLEARIAPHIEELADALAREVGARPTVVFTPDVGSAQAMADALTKKAVPASDISGRMPKSERRRVLAQFRAGDLQTLCCCDLLTEGWDCPRVSCIGVCRPTRKRNRYAQMIGRGTRPDPGSGKADCLVVDFAWETTAGHRLVTPIDLFDDTAADPAVMAKAAELLGNKDGATADPREAIDEAERLIALERKFQVRITGIHAMYRKTVFDPVGAARIVGVPLRHGFDFDADQGAFPAQLDMLGRLGLDAPGDLSRVGATRIINGLLKRKRDGLASLENVAALESFGVDPAQSRTLGHAAASTLLDELRPARRKA